MKRMHIGLKVADIEESVDFYSRMFGQEPTLQRDDYAKWMLDDPYVNFSIDVHGVGPVGSAHYGVQVESSDALAAARAHIDEVGIDRDDQNDLICGYQLQHKSWIRDPHGVPWETFFTEGVVEGSSYGSEDMPECGC
ncbi:MAG: VOC family protein [Actinomycetota bacterium]|jgi:catechol 2,3-dioxygenase-like lactoylglutathione lyase family enzyme|nr:VOC family protein [Actinomycetota bacterium]